MNALKLLLVIGWTTVLLIGRAAAQTNAECFECHGEKDLTTKDERGEIRSWYIEAAVFSRSIHADFACVDCHADIRGLPHEDILEKVDCGQCHDDAQTAVATSVHGDSLRARSSDAPSCAHCHGSHDIRAVNDPESMVSKRKQAKTCAVCHANPEIVERNLIRPKNPVALYEKSIHGELAMREASGGAATCSDCHGGHAILRATNPQAQIYKMNIPATCGRCHPDEMAAYNQSVHAAALESSMLDAPVCTNCHREHDILRPDNPAAPTSGFNVAVEVCSPCHASERLAEKYGLNTARVNTYRASYHGLALRGGKAAVANCGSCHGVHDILPSSDSRSKIAPANLARTCGTCHPNASENFTRGKIHLLEGEQETRIIAFIRALYIVLIAVLIGFMFLHNALDFLAKSKQTLKRRYHANS